MSALGQKQTSPHVGVMSALPPKSGMPEFEEHVRFVPKADIAIHSFQINRDERWGHVGDRRAEQTWQSIIWIRHYERCTDIFPVSWHPR